MLITVDNGITAFDAAAQAKLLGIDLIITDHHRPYDTVPEAYASLILINQIVHIPIKNLQELVLRLSSFLFYMNALISTS